MDNRIVGVSIARIIACFSIILCHVFQFYNNDLAWWFNGGVNVFLVISGFLYAKKRVTFNSFFEWKSFLLKFYIKEFTKILLPLWLHIIISAPIYYQSGTPLVDILKLFFLKNDGISGFGYLWFFKYILICYLFLPFYYAIAKEKYKNMVVIGLLLFLLIFSNGNLIWLTCFVTGMFLSFAFKSRLFKCFCFITIIASAIMISICLLLNVDRYNLNYLLNLQKLLTGTSILCLCLLLFKNTQKLNIFLNYLDTNSYFIFLVHPLFLTGALSMMNCLDGISYNIVLFVFFTLAYSYAFGLLCNRINKAIEGCANYIFTRKRISS